MGKMPVWLPDMISLEGCAQYESLERLYTVFKRDFIENPPVFSDCPVWHDCRVLEGQEYEEGFLHLVTKEDFLAGRRTIDRARAERLPWCRPTIDHPADPAVKVFAHIGNRGRSRTYLWIEDADYLVILEKKRVGKRMVYFLVTAYYVDGESSRRSVRRKYEKSGA